MSTNVQLGVSTVMTGEVLDRTDGGHEIAMADMVCLIPYIDDKQAGNYNMTPEQAMALASALAQAAGQILNRQVDDNGQPLGLLTRLNRLAGNAN